MSLNEIRKLAQAVSLSDDDIALAGTSDDELRARTQLDSMSLEDFNDRMKVGMLWAQVVQTHLYFDHVLTLMLRGSLARPDALEIKRIGFYQKLQLVSGLGLLPEDLVLLIEKLNWLRNRFAHDLDFKVSDQDSNSITSACPDNIRDLIINFKNREPGPISTIELLETVLWYVEMTRQRLAYARILNRKAEIKTILALKRFRT